MALTPSLARPTPAASNDSEVLTEAQKLAMASDLTKAARYTLISLPRQSIGRLALKYRHVGSPHLKDVARPTLKTIVYGPKFAVMDRFSQSYVMARESMRHALGHIHMGAIHYKRDTRGFSFKVWSMACDSIINHVLERLPEPDQARDAIKYGVRRCEELGVVKWEDVRRQVRKTAAKRGIEPGPVFEKEPNELNSLQIYQAIMKVVRETAEAQKAEGRTRSWAMLLMVLDETVEKCVADPKSPLKSDPLVLGPIEFYDALANVVRVYNNSAYPADHEGAGDVDVEDWKLLAEAIHALVAKAIEDPAHAFTENPRRRSISLWNDLVAILKEFVDFEADDRFESDDESIIDEIAEELNLIETLRDAIEEAAKEPEANLINQARQIEGAFRRMQAGAGQGDALLEVAPPMGLTRTPWRRALAAMASTALITRFQMDPTKPSRRSVASTYQARFHSNGRRQPVVQHPRLIRHAKAKKAVFIIDTSGSIYADRAVLEQLLREAVSVCKRVNTVLTVIFADSGVCDVIQVGEAYEMIKTLQPKGGGGTDFRPGIEAAEAMNPDLIIYATDLCGTFPAHKPKCPIIWAYPPEWDHIETPFGQRLPLVP
jgi:hypothetical protein